MNKPKITSVVISGGPCGGKTSGMTHSINEITEKVKNSKVFVIPEAATQLFDKGISIGKNGISNLAFQDLIIKQQLHNEFIVKSAIENLSKSKDIQHIIVLHDRGLLDSAAYMIDKENNIDRNKFEKILKNNEVSKVVDGYGNYEAVLHYQTAAKGAEEFFSSENNKFRKESAEEARNQDTLTEQAWLGHPHFRVINNGADIAFRDKINKGVNEILNLIGYPETLEREDWYTVNDLDTNHPVLKGAIKSEIEQIYLHHPDPDAANRIRRRTRGKESLYTQTIKIKKHGQPIENEHSITEDQYNALRAFQLPNTIVLKKQRYNFLRDNQYMELDYFLNGKLKGKHKLECEKTQQNDKVTIPPFIQVGGDVTGDHHYSNKYLATLD